MLALDDDCVGRRRLIGRLCLDADFADSWRFFRLPLLVRLVCFDVELDLFLFPILVLIIRSDSSVWIVGFSAGIDMSTSTGLVSEDI